jgi:hypothetical protein
MPMNKSRMRGKFIHIQYLNFLLVKGNYLFCDLKVDEGAVEWFKRYRVPA